MHELSIARSLVAVCDEAAREAGAARVTRVYLRLGAIAGVVVESLRFAWDYATAHSLVEGAELVIEPVALEVKCDACGHAGPPVGPQRLRCVQCDAPTPNVLSGRELVVRAIDYDLAAGQESDAGSSLPSGAATAEAPAADPVPSPAAARQHTSANR